MISVAKPNSDRQNPLLGGVAPEKPGRGGAGPTAGIRWGVEFYTIDAPVLSTKGKVPRPEPPVPR